MRNYRKITEGMAVRRARKEGAELFRVRVIQVLEDRLGVLELDGRAAASIIREIRLD